FALTVGSLRSVDTRSCRYALGSAQSHCVITTFRSTPDGRGGAGGTAPAAILSVQSANIFNTPSLPHWCIDEIIEAPAWPDCKRRCHASTDDSNSPNAGCNSRVPFVPNA